MCRTVYPVRYRAIMTTKYLKISRFWNDKVRPWCGKTSTNANCYISSLVIKDNNRASIKECLNCKVARACEELRYANGPWNDYRFNGMPSWNKLPREEQIKIKVWYLKWLVSK